MTEKNNAIEKLISTVAAIETASALQPQETFKDLQNALQPVICLLEDRASRCTKKNREKERAYALLEEIKVLRRLAEETTATFSVIKSIQRRQDMIIEKMIFNLKDVLARVVTPAIKSAANARDNQTVTQWGQIDIFINDLILNTVLNLQTTAHQYLAEGSAETERALWAARDKVAEDLTAWKEMIDGKAALKKTCVQVLDNVKSFTAVSNGLPDLFRRMAENRTAIRNRLPVLLTDLKLFMEDPGKIEKPSPIKRLIELVSLPG